MIFCCVFMIRSQVKIFVVTSLTNVDERCKAEADAIPKSSVADRVDPMLTNCWKVKSLLDVLLIWRKKGVESLNINSQLRISCSRRRHWEALSCGGNDEIEIGRSLLGEISRWLLIESIITVWNELIVTGGRQKYFGQSDESQVKQNKMLSCGFGLFFTFRPQ